MLPCIRPSPFVYGVVLLSTLCISLIVSKENKPGIRTDQERVLEERPSLFLTRRIWIYRSRQRFMIANTHFSDLEFQIPIFQI